MTWVDDSIIQSAAQLIVAGLDELPVEDTAEWRGYNNEDAKAFKALIEELNWPDLCVALRLAAERLPEPTYDDEAG